VKLLRLLSYDGSDIKFDGEEEVDFDGLRFVGLVSMIDPPREGVAEAVKECRSASIKVSEAGVCLLT